MRIFLGGGDEGTLIYGAVRVTEGQVPQRDFFEVMGPGSFYWLALFFKLFGSTFLASRISVALASICTALLMYYLARRLKTRYDTVPAILFLATSFGGLWPANSHHHDSNLFSLLAFTALIGWIDTRRSWILGLTGALAGVTTLFLQPKGILLLLSFVLLLFLFRNGTTLKSSLGWLAGSYFAVGLLVVLFYWRAGGLWDLIYANVVWPVSNYSGVNAVPYGYGIQKWYWERWIAALGAVLSPTIAFGIASLLIIPFLFVAALPVIGALFAIFRRRLASYSSTLPYWLAGAAMWLSEIHRKDIVHLVLGSPLLMIACVSCMAGLASQPSLVETDAKYQSTVRGYSWRLLRKRPYKICSFALKIIWMSSIALAEFNAFNALAAHKKIVSRRGAFYAFYPDPILEFVDAHIPKGEEIFAYPYCPEYYFLSATRNPTRFSVLMYHINTDAQFHEAMRSLDERRVRYVIWGREFSRLAKLEGWPAYSLPPEEELILEPYLVKRYRVLAHINGADILERRNDFFRP